MAPRRTRRFAAMVGALLLGTGAVVPIAAPAAAMQAATPDAATRAALEKRTAARTMLSSAVGRLATNANDTAALLDAGRASIELEDYRAAITFLTRAEQASPRDGAIKAALGSAMVHMETPTRALDYFGEAQLLGAPERLFLADRGLARDLLGQQDAAQRDYQLALSIAPNDETVRRYALSLAISGEPDRAVQFLTPQLKAQDRAAWRLRAMILAINGRNDEATQIVNATMPPALAQNIIPYLTQLDRLNPAQQAAAAHFGRFPSGQLGPPRKPIQVAAATPPPAAVAAGKRGKPPAVTPKPAPASVRQPALASAEPLPPGFSPTPKPAAARQPDAAGANPYPPGFSPTPKPAPTPPLAEPRPAATLAPPPRPAAAAILPAPAPTAAPGAPPSQSPIRPAATVPSADPAAVPAPGAVSPPPADAAKGPIGPGFSINDLGKPVATDAAPPPSGSAPPAVEAAAVAPPPAPPPATIDPAPLASLAAIASSIEIPTEELAQADNAIGADTLAKLRDDKRRADAAEDAKRAKDEAAAKAKAEADAKAKAEAAEKKANPARVWVQIATGANPKALATDFGKFAKKSPDVFKGKAGATTEWGKTRRLLVGPFKDRKAAQDWLASYKKAGGDGFLFNSEAGQDVDPIK